MTSTEKLTLLMMCDLFDHLGVDGEIDSSIVREAVDSGNTWAIERKYQFLSTEEVPKEVQKKVDSALTAYRNLSNSLRTLTPDESNELKDKHKLKIHDKHIQFPGYDGNNESDYMSVAFMLGKLGLYTEQLEIDKNSHEENVNSYDDLISALTVLKDAGHNVNKLEKPHLDEVLSLCPNFYD
ncbi:Uncharacterised protein [Serratia liquefaciens]|uniref:YfbU family protein n=1 Tax=Serratia liquefaciens TaxID=614 RepID=UPI002182F631|nr:YfbU family protein [Serratia liquefaciens]CAI2407488.1 Uncharacterised protein [Serratia liquefaciens]